MGALKVLIAGQKFGRLTIIRRGENKHHQAAWECLCDCGNITTIEGWRLTAKDPDVRSCGCYRTERRITHGMTYTLNYTMWESAKRRARKKNLPFDITPVDIVIPKRCPLLGMKLVSHKGGSAGPDSPTLDKIVPSKGYTKDNIMVISAKANSIKSYATLEELEQLVTSWRRYAPDRKGK